MHFIINFFNNVRDWRYLEAASGIIISGDVVPAGPPAKA